MENIGTRASDREFARHARCQQEVEAAGSREVRVRSRGPSRAADEASREGRTQNRPLECARTDPYQFSVGILSTWSTTKISVGNFRGSSLSPSCSCKAVKIEGGRSPGVAG